MKTTLRADSGFWSRAIGDFLLAKNLPFVFAIALHHGLKLLIRTRVFRALEGDTDIEVTRIGGELLSLEEHLRIAVIRRKVHDPKAPPQGKAIDGDPAWRYQALITTLPGEPEEVWRLYNGRADCERVFKVAKHALGMSWLISHELRANNAAFLLRLLAYNMVILFQRHVEKLATDRKRAVMRQGLLTRQHRFYNNAGRLLRAGDQWLLRVAQNGLVARCFAFYAPDLTVMVT